MSNARPMGQPWPGMAERDPASAIAAVSVPGMVGGGAGGWFINQAPRDVLFVLTELGHVYRIVDGGLPALVFSPQPTKEQP